MSQDAFSPSDLQQIEKKGITEEMLGRQIENFRNEFPPVSLVEPAFPGNGMIRLSPEEVKSYGRFYADVRQDLKIVKFVPASGAASRMFKSLFEYLNDTEGNTGGAEHPDTIKELLDGMDRLALRDDLVKILAKQGKTLDGMLRSGEGREIIRLIVEKDGLNYGQLPKGLLQFHKYTDENRTPAEEHMVEGAQYCRGKDGMVNLHFTVSPEHRELFTELIERKQGSFGDKFGVRYRAEFSTQRPDTDTMAVDMQNKPFRDPDGSIVFRPGGHGALLANLNEIDADLIFIKNIDNVCPDRMKELTYRYKRALAGILLKFRDRNFGYIRQLESGDLSGLEEIEHFLGNELYLRLADDYGQLDFKARAEMLLNKLNRPMRVCGMVKNEGEPGGGPFWCLNRDGTVSIQIVESAQINFKDEKQAAIASGATHFNPVDLVCITRDYRGEPFELKNYTDPDTGLISIKSRDGRSLKAQELPGLWNGSMSDWNTVFVEVPIETFTPVKTINDLLRKEHLA
jgi:hypothetical protein